MGDATEMPRNALEPIAICGISMRLPGAVRDANAFWKALVEKSDFKCRVPEDRFNVEAFYSPHGKPGTIISPEAFYLTDADLGHLDTSVFPIAAHELRHIDPQQRMLLEVTRECLENAGETDWRGKRVGCYVGTFGEDWVDLGAKDILDTTMYRAAGSSDFALSNRLSYEYDFRGPSMTIKTGCSAAMMGLNEACWAINAGQCDAAIVAGSNLIMTPTMTISMGAAALSPTGSCKTFDAEADGYARGEAVNAIFIKRLSNALADGNAVRAVIRGIGVNSDGQTSRTLTPSLVCQESLIRQTYAQAGLSPYDTAFFECHGTGTRVGDPIEAGAVDRVFGDFGIHIGAVKPNFGHSEGASAITSIIEAVLALEKRVIPPNMRFSNPNPAINWGSRRLMMPTEVTSWPEDREERVSVNSFGIGGANGHVILDSARTFTPVQPSEGIKVCVPSTHLLVLSAAHEKSLARLKGSYEALLSRALVPLNDLAHTLGSRRQHHQHRTYCVKSAEGQGETFSSTAGVPGTSQKVVFAFSGQGTVWPRMARELMQENLIFRQTLHRLDKVLAALPECSFSLEEEMSREGDKSRLHKAEIAQPVSTAAQICLCNSLEALGVQPSAVIGHSSGEIAAAYAAGALTEVEAIKAAFYRGQAIFSDSRRGAMSSIGLGRDVVEKIPLHGAVLVCDNSPSSITLAGQADQLEAVEEEVEERYPNALVKRLQVDKAYHSHPMKAAGDSYVQMLDKQLRPARPKVPFYSALMGRLLPSSETLSPAYWKRHLESPVLFRAAAEQIVSDMKQDIVFVEIGAHPTLTSSLIQICAEHKVPHVSHVSFMRRSSNSMRSFLEGVGRLYQLGVPLDFHSLTPGGKTLTDLPNYAWHHDKKHWNETRLAREWRFREYPRHDLLGVRTGESSSIEPSWRNLLRLDDVGWISHHQVGSDVVLPFTAYVAMAGEAIQQVHRDRGPFSLRRVRVGATLTLGQSDTVEVITTLRPARLTDFVDSAWFDFTISSYDGSQWNKHCHGLVRLGRDPSLDKEWQTPDLARRVDTETWYKALANVGLNYGAEFRKLDSISADVTHFKAAAVVEDTRSPTDSHYEVHPATLDPAVQLIGVAASRGLSREVQNLFVPVAVEDLYIDKAVESLAVRAEAEVSSRGVVTGDVLGQSGLRVKGLTLYPLDGMAMEKSSDPHAAAELVWATDIGLSGLSAALQGREQHEKRNKLVQDTVSLLGHANPLCSVLELNEDSSTTEGLLSALTTPFGEKLYSTYTIAHPNEASLSTSKERFKAVDRIEHVVMELSRDMSSQNLPSQAYDVVLVTDGALRTSQSLEKTLSGLRQLLRPDGSLVVHREQTEGPSFVELADTMSKAGFSDIEQHDEVILFAKASKGHWARRTPP